jgi:acetyltransferase-like isoleucine patch superfamily enzyme
MDPTRRGNVTPSPVHIGADVWLGANVTVLPGVTIGDGAVVAAGAVVAKDVAPRTLVAGVPAREVRRL